jgi:hypothetical protein
MIQVTALLLGGGVLAGAQAPPQLPGPGFPGQFGQPGQIPFGRGPMGTPAGMMSPLFATPETAGKMVSIMALRQINAVGMTPRDLGAALPILRSMRELEKNTDARLNQILDEEKRALLAAPPNAPFPPDSGQRVQMITESYRQQMDGAWMALTKGIGPDKAGLLRSLIEGGPMMGMNGPMPPGGFGVGPNFPGAPNGQPQPFGSPPLPPGQPDERAPQPGIQAPNPGSAQDAQRPPFGQPNGFDGQRPGQPGFGGRPGQPGQGSGFPGQNPGNFGPGMPGMSGMAGMGGPRMSLADLVDLLEQKQAAMRH